MTERIKGLWELKQGELFPVDPEVEKWAEVVWRAKNPNGSSGQSWPPIYNLHEYRTTAKAIISELLRKELTSLTEYDMHSEVGIKFQDLLSRWTVGEVNAYEVWNFVRDSLTKEKK